MICLINIVFVTIVSLVIIICNDIYLVRKIKLCNCNVFKS